MMPSSWSSAGCLLLAPPFFCRFTIRPPFLTRACRNLGNKYPYAPHNKVARMLDERGWRRETEAASSQWPSTAAPSYARVLGPLRQVRVFMVSDHLPCSPYG
jgi:hypothetical protein